VNQVLEGDHRIFVNYDPDDGYYLLRLGELADNNSGTSAYNMTPVSAIYGCKLQSKCMKEPEARNPGANHDAHWMQTIHEQGRQSLQKTIEATGGYYDQKAKEHPDFKIGDIVIHNAKNICTKCPSNKLEAKLFGPFGILEQRGDLTYKLELLERWEMNTVFHVSLLEHYRISIRLDREQPPMEREPSTGDLAWLVAKTFETEIISHDRRVCGRTRTFEELRYFVMLRACGEDENMWEPPEQLELAQEFVEDFHRENPDMPRLG